MKSLKQIVEISSLILGFLIFNGFLKLDIFYKHWGVNIIEYLDLSEVILLFLNDIALFLFFIVALLLHTFLGSFATKNENIDNTFQKVLDTKLGISVFLGFTLLISVISYYMFFYDYNLRYLYVFIFVGLQFLIKLIDTVFKKRKFITDKSLHISFLIIFVFFTYFKSQYDIYNKEKDLNKYVVNFENGDKIIVDSSALLLGKTKRYVFLWDKKTRTSRILNRDKIIELTETKR